MADQKLSNPKGASFTSSTPDLQQVTQKLDSLMEQVVRVDEDLVQLKDRLTGMQKSKLEIIPIVGMGGIGKTTLARKLYQDPSIVSHFQYARAWATISQDYNMRAILLGLLRYIIGKKVDKHIEKENNKLKDILYKSLFGRRYIIVVDDIWSTKFWDEMRKYFPDNNNGSRIVITTRESNVAKHADSQSVQHQVQLLSESESWNLLGQIVFGEEDCSDVLQGIGRKIASDCGGLPLAIHVIGGLLSKVERSRDVWENIGNDVRAALLAESGEQFSNILSLSYNHLPNHLRPCFLFMGAFPEDHEIKGSKLMHMWVAEGLIVKSNSDKSLEEDAKDCLKALVGRNLVLVKKKKPNGKPKSYSTHDLIRDLCIEKADEEIVNKSPEDEVTFSNPHRVSVSVSVSVSVHTKYGSSWEDKISISALRMLRVLDVKKKKYNEFSEKILQLVNLRYLAISCGSGLPRKISKLCNLQTLIAKIGSGRVPFEIWELSELRHLKLNKPILMEDGDMKFFVQNKLQAISTVVLGTKLISFGFFESIPDIKDLSIHCNILLSTAIDLTHLHRLQTLRCKSGVGSFGRRFLSTLIFPSTLRKLTLFKCGMFPRVLTKTLPNLEVLKIEECVFESKDGTHDQVWEMAAEGDEFRSLQFLQLKELNLKHWRADETNFPRLHRLILDYCSELEEIPKHIGEIPTLQLIELKGCSASAVASANQIEEEQSEFRNYIEVSIIRTM